MEKIDDILRSYWGYTSFRPLQKEIVLSVLHGNDTLALLPTGGGKSLCFQLPAMAMRGLCLVVSPLIALMQDQVEQLGKKQIKAIALTSGMNGKEVDAALNACTNGQVKFLYISPERLKSERFRFYLPKLNPCLIAVDEAHCISQWGYDFRPSYLSINEIRTVYPMVPIMALTASATRPVIEDIQDKLQFRKQRAVFRKSFYRSNLHYVVQLEENKFTRLIKICHNISGSGVIYVRNRKRTEEVSEYLNSMGFQSDFYHAGLHADARMYKQKYWIDNKFRIMVATNAFGMGIDKPDVRFVVHLDLPDSLEAYFQEAGRAGRDEKSAWAVMLYDKNDVVRLEESIDASFPPMEEIKRCYTAIANYYQLAVGAGQGMSLGIDIPLISAKYGIKPQLMYNAIRILEREGYFSFQEMSHEPSKIYVNASREELYNFQIKFSRYESLIKTLLRSYGGIMNTYVPFNETLLARRCALTIDELVKQLLKLQDYGMVQYIPREQLPMLTFLEPRQDSKYLYLSPDNYANLKSRAHQRARQVEHYVSEEEVCRSRILLTYFNEREFEDCGYCDVCLKKKRDLKGKTSEIKDRILHVLGYNRLVISDVCAKLYQYPQDEVIGELNLMIDDGVLVLDEERYVSISQYFKNE